MITATKTSTDSIISNMDSSSRTSKTNLSNKSTSELYKADDSRTTAKSEDFKKVLSSKANSKEKEYTEKVDDVSKSYDSTEVTEVKDTDNLDELKEKLKELEEESKSASKDEAGDILTQLLALLAKLGIKEEDLKANGKIDTNILKNVIDEISNVKSSDSNLNGIMEKIMELLKSDSVKDKLDTNSLKVMEKLLSNLGANIVEDNTEATKDVKSNIKNLMSEISNILNDKQDQGKKVLTLEDMLNRNYSQDNSESSTGDESSNATTSKESKVISKEDKFLNSLLDDNKDSSSNKINLFASRASVIQNQGVNTTVRGLTINKATFTEDLIKDVKFMSNNGLKELIVKVNPGNLGEITIKLVQEDGLMKANLKANSKETTELISQNLTDIKKQLGEQNIKIADVNIELYQEDTTFFSKQGFEGQLAGEQNKQNASSQNKVSDNEIALNENLDENLAQENSNVNFFA